VRVSVNRYIKPLKRCQVPSGGRDESPQGDDSFPCLYSNNSTEQEATTPEKFNLLSPYHRKQAKMIYENAEKFIKIHGFSKTGFLTLTFSDNVADNKEASRRFNSLKTHFFPKHFDEYLLMKERQDRGAWHYHVLVACRKNIRDGIDFDAIYGRSKNGVRNKIKPDYRSANPYLRSLWKSLRENLPSFSFGRSELLPIESSAEAAGRYMGKYVSKHIGSRKEEDKGVRLFSCSRSFQRAANTNFAWHTDGSREWRRKLAYFAKITGIQDFDEMKNLFGPSWAYHLGSYIAQVDTLMPHEIIRIKKVYSQRRQFFINEPPSMSHDGFLIHESTGELLF